MINWDLIFHICLGMLVYRIIVGIINGTIGGIIDFFKKEQLKNENKRTKTKTKQTTIKSI